MTLHDRHAFEYYYEGAKTAGSYRVMPADVSEISDGLGTIYTYCHYDRDTQMATYAIGKVKET